MNLFSDKIFFKGLLYLTFGLIWGEGAYGQINVVKTYKAYCESAGQDKFMQMIPLSRHDFRYDLRYATVNNFTQTRLYKHVKYTFLRILPAEALQKANLLLKAEGLCLKIFDAYRPYSATEKMWVLIHDPRYVADPLKGSGHNRGLAIDLTLSNLLTGQDLNMGTGFDNFTDSAHHSFKQFPEEILQNRAKLRKIMEQAGFSALETEWWHYSWPDDRHYDVLDLPFQQLAKNCR